MILYQITIRPFRFGKPEASTHRATILDILGGSDAPAPPGQVAYNQIGPCRQMPGRDPLLVRLQVLLDRFDGLQRRKFDRDAFVEVPDHGCPQFAEEKFFLDFALFAEGKRLNIEVDGERYHRDWNGELLRRDQLRNMRLIELGWDVMRFWVYQLRDDMPECVQRVQTWARAG